MNLLLNHSETRRCGWRERAALLLLVCAASLYLSSITSNPSLDDVHMQRPQHEAPPPHSLRRRLWGRSRERQQRQQQVQREESLVNFLDPKSVELRHDVMYDSWHSNNQRPLTVTAAEAEEVSTTSLEVMGDLPPVLSGDYVSEEDYDAAYRAAQEEQLSSSPSDRRQYSIIQPYTLEDALSESNVFKKIFALIVYDPPSDRFIGLYSKDHQINGMGARLIHSTRTLVYMLRHIFPERFTPDMPELVLAISSGDYPSVHVSKVRKNYYCTMLPSHFLGPWRKFCAKNNASFGTHLQNANPSKTLPLSLMKLVKPSFLGINFWFFPLQSYHIPTARRRC